MAQPRMTGTWSGELAEFKFVLDLIQVPNHEHVSGLLRVGGFEQPGHVVGINSYPEVALSGSLLHGAAAFNGLFDNPDEISGTMRFQDSEIPVTFHRDPTSG